jgi:hypothetical protein
VACGSYFACRSSCSDAFDFTVSSENFNTFCELADTDISDNSQYELFNSQWTDEHDWTVDSVDKLLRRRIEKWWVKLAENACTFELPQNALYDLLIILHRSWIFQLMLEH